MCSVGGLLDPEHEPSSSLLRALPLSCSVNRRQSPAAHLGPNSLLSQGETAQGSHSATPAHVRGSGLTGLPVALPSWGSRRDQDRTLTHSLGGLAHFPLCTVYWDARLLGWKAALSEDLTM